MNKMIKMLATVATFCFGLVLTASARPETVGHLVVNDHFDLTNGFQAVQSEPAEEFGGAILVELGGTLESDDLVPQVFKGFKSAYAGGVIYNEDTVDIWDAQFIGNSAFTNIADTAFCNTIGGAICSIGDVYLWNVDFIENRADFGGALYNCGFASLSRVRFIGNGAAIGGESIMEDGSAICTEEDSEIVIDEVVISNSVANTVGGAFYNRGVVRLNGRLTLATESDTFYNRGSLVWGKLVYDWFNYEYSSGYVSNFGLINNEVLVDGVPMPGQLIINVNPDDVPGSSRYVLAGGAEKKQPESRKYFTLTNETLQAGATIKIGQTAEFNGKTYSLYIEDGRLLLEVLGDQPEQIVVANDDVKSLAGVFRGYTNEIGGAIRIEEYGNLALGKAVFAENAATGSVGSAIYNEGQLCLMDAVYLNGPGETIHNAEDTIMMWSLARDGIANGWVSNFENITNDVGARMYIGVPETISPGTYELARGDFSDLTNKREFDLFDGIETEGIAIGGNIVRFYNRTYRLYVEDGKLLLNVYYQQRKPDYSTSADWILNEQDSTRPVDLFFVIPSAVESNTVLTTVEGAVDIDDPKLRANAMEQFLLTGAVFTNYSRAFVPYYRQLTMEGMLAHVLDENGIPRRNSVDVWEEAVLQCPGYDDVYDALDRYFEANPNRQFILAGHSQGSVICKLLMENYFVGERAIHTNRMVACYAPGLAVTNDFINGVAIATEESNSCVYVTWNTEGPNNSTNMVMRKGAKVINPLSWKVDEEPVPETENEGTLINWKTGKTMEGIAEAQLNLTRGVVICTNITDYGPTYYLGPASLHEWDYAAYWISIKKNAFIRFSNMTGLVPVETVLIEDIPNGSWKMINDEGTVEPSVVGYRYDRTKDDLKVKYEAAEGYYFADGETNVTYRMVWNPKTDTFQPEASFDVPVAGKPATMLGLVAQHYPWNGKVDVFYRPAFIPNDRFQLDIYANEVLVISNITLTANSYTNACKATFNAKDFPHLDELQTDDLKVEIKTKEVIPE